MEPTDIFTNLGPWRWVFAQRSGTDSSRGLHTAGTQYKFICIEPSDKKKCVRTCVPGIYTMHLNCPRTEDVCLRALHCQSFTWLELIILRKGAVRWEEWDGLLQSSFSVWEMETFGWIALFSQDLLPSISRFLKSNRDFCNECSLLPENLNFC